MRESVFIKQNIARWRDYQRRLANPSYEDPDTLAQMYTELTSDLAFSRTHFPDATITSMLNAMTLKLHNEIYSGHQEKWSRLWTFWTDEVPQAIYDNRKAMLSALAVFVFFLLVGIVSLFNDDNFARLILGDGYVDMTIENIRKGAPTGVYSQGPEALSFFGIMLNNLRVDVICVSLGIFTPFATALVMMYNAIMVGAFTFFFFQYGVFGDAMMAIMQHGTLEISTIVLSGGAGFVMGSGWLFPGTYSRMQAFRRKAKEGLKIAVSIFPVTVVAAFIEGYLTRHTEYPVAFRVMVIVLSAMFIIFYFIVLPYLKGRKRLRESASDEQQPTL
ncbi:MAG: stage II sporulation protein M [Muribaculaceae bacterium]|nr:stage II sporulation protein M [Muribaculaceae bacterium]